LIRRDLIAIGLPALLAACSSTGAATTVPTLATASEALLGASIARLAAAWNTSDGDAWAAEYWPDGSLINIQGVVFPNSTAVGGVTNHILAGPFKGSSFAPTITRTRFAGGDAAVVDVDVSVTNFRALPPGAVATKPGLLLTRFTFVFEQRNDVWKIEASQNTAVLPSAAAGQPA
jgi:uncharacterized protein (TIGR02246 family)